MSKLKPYYKQIADELERDIISGKFSAGSRLPTEREIQERFYVSRMTVRQAYKLLEKKGTAVIVKNKGIFVKDTCIEREQSVLSAKDLFINAGLKSNTKIKNLEVILANDKIKEKLQLADDEKVYYLHRQRYVSDELILIEESYLPVERFPNLLQYDFAINSLYEVINENYGVEIKRVDDYISADLVNGEEAMMLTKSKKGPTLKLVTVAYDSDGKPIEYSESLCNYRVYTYKAVHEVDK